MTTYKRFEDLPVWQDALFLAGEVYKLTALSPLDKNYGLKDQLERATVSISNNIAEGFERGTTNELLYFLYVAKGSAGEARSMFCLINRLFPEINPEKIAGLRSTVEGISKQLRSWADSLQNSDITGQRHLNDRSKRYYHQKKEEERFWEELKREAKKLEEQRLKERGLDIKA